jgi:signal transduction histidine kinase/ActR/RegA family two-component response regulator
VVPACVVPLLHFGVIRMLGAQTLGFMINNSLQMFLNAVAVIVSLQAARRSSGLARYFWRVAASCFALFVFSLVLGQITLIWPSHVKPMLFSDEISVFWMAPLSLTLFLEPDFELRRFDPIHLLDFAQIALFWTAVYIFFLFMPDHLGMGTSLHGWLHQTWAGSLVYDVSMFTLFGLRAVLSSTRDMRKLFGWFTVLLVVGCGADFYANYLRLDGGGWFGLVWTGMDVFPIVLAGTWKQNGSGAVNSHGKRLIADRFFPVLTALLVLLLSMVIVRDHLLFAVIMVAISFLCSSTRMVVLQQRQQTIARDLEAEIVERARAEQLLRENEEHLEDQVAKRTGELRHANEQLRQEIDGRQRLEEQLRQTQKMEAIGTLSGGIAHDFNNLLTVIRGYARLVLDRVEHDPGLRADVQQIDEAGARAAALTSQLLAFSRRQMLQPKAVSLNLLVRDLNKMLKRLIGEDVELDTVLAPSLGTVQADPGQIEQVVMNLVVNARDAMPRGGNVTLSTANVDLDDAYAREHVYVRPGSYVMLAVSDTGTGIPEEIRSHIFEPFFTTKERARGTGLGLSTVYGIVKASGGSIEVESEMGRGSTFKIFLPRVRPDEEVESHVQPVDVTHGSESVLLVEDDAQVRTLARSILVRCGYKVLTAASGEEAVRICQQTADKFELMLTDVVMPGLSGREVAERVATCRPEMKVLYMSGYTDDAIVHHGVLETGIALLQKPFTPNSLAAKVREVLDTRATAEKHS